MRRAAVVALALAACASDPPPAPGRSDAPAAAASPGQRRAFPPEGPVSLALPAARREGIPFRIVIDVDGEQEVTPPSGRGRPQTQSESNRLELYYRELPAKGSKPGERARTLILDGLRLRRRDEPPPREREVELADDRLQIRDDGKVSIDLRGAQPKENLTPRTLLGRPFALLRQDLRGEARAIAIRGAPPARKFLKPLALRGLLAWTRVARPGQPVEPGARWTSSRLPSNAVGALGLAIPLTYELTGYEELEGVGCAWIVIRGELDREDAPSRLGFQFDRALARVEGEAWIEVATGELRRLVLEDDVRVGYERGEGAAAVQLRFRYKGRTVVDRGTLGPPRGLWADGAKRFRDR